MKNLHNYLTEKLKLSDINPRYIERWVDAKELRLWDLKEGNVVETERGMRYIVVTKQFADNVIGENGYNKITEFPLLLYKPGAYLRLDNYKNTYPENKNTRGFAIVRVYTREKSYITKKDLKVLHKDLENRKEL